jgi:hypothetical protein
MYFIYCHDRWFDRYKCARNEWPWHRGGDVGAGYSRLLKKGIDEFVGNQISIIIMMLAAFYITDSSTTVCVVCAS